MDAIIIIVARYFYLISIVFCVWFFLRAQKTERRRILFVSIFALPLSYLLGLLASMLYYDPRPFVVLHFTPLLSHAADNGFPSDHALLLGTLAAIVTVFNKKLGVILWVLAVLVGAARVLALVHHSLDIIGSFVIASIATAAVYLSLKRFSSVLDTSPEPTQPS